MTKVTLNVTVPAEATAGAQLIDVTGTTPGGSTTLHVTIRVEPNAAGQVTLTTDTPQLKGASNTSFSFSLTLTNDTAEDLPFSATSTGPDGWTVTPQVGSTAQAASVVGQGRRHDAGHRDREGVDRCSRRDLPDRGGRHEREPDRPSGPVGRDHRELHAEPVDLGPAPQHERDGRRDERPDARPRRTPAPPTWRPPP